MEELEGMGRSGRNIIVWGFSGLRIAYTSSEIIFLSKQIFI